MNINGFEVGNGIIELCMKDRHKVIKLIESNDLDSCTRLVRLLNGKEAILQVDVLFDLMEIDFNYESVKLYLFNEDKEKKDLQKF